MNWKKWKQGLFVAILTGLCTALATGLIIPSMTPKEGLYICLGSIAKDVLLYLREHKVIETNDENKTTTG